MAKKWLESSSVPQDSFFYISISTMYLAKLNFAFHLKYPYINFSKDVNQREVKKKMLAFWNIQTIQ